MEALSDTPFPLKKYYLLYAGIGAIVFYTLLFLLFIHAERTALYNEYINSLSEKAKALHQDIKQDILDQNHISLEQLLTSPPEIRDELRNKLQQIASTDSALTSIKLFRTDGITLYDQASKANEGLPYASRNDDGFKKALTGEVAYEVEKESDGQRSMEIYLPIRQPDTNQVTAILELYEDVSKFENQVQDAMKKAFPLPTLVFIAFNILLYLIIAKADRLIAANTNLLITIRQNMEKYLSQSAVAAIREAVTSKRELFHGDRKQLVILFSDVRGFTHFSENTEPESVVKKLNQLFQIQADIIHQQGGIIDKFIGDEIMAIFPAGMEEEATQAALTIIERLNIAEDNNLKIGIGIHAGEAVVGSLGTSERRDYTAIGDTINTGSRICAACAADTISISNSVYENLSDELKNKFSHKQLLKLKGKSDPFLVYLTEK